MSRNDLFSIVAEGKREAPPLCCGRRRAGATLTGEEGCRGAVRPVPARSVRLRPWGGKTPPHPKLNLASADASGRPRSNHYISDHSPITHGQPTMRAAILAPVVIALLAGPASATPLGSSDVQGLIREYNAANAPCRAADGTLTTKAACDRRAAYGLRLNELHWCFGKNEQSAPEMRWHRCGASSLLYGE